MDTYRFIKIRTASIFLVGATVLTACSEPPLVGVWQSEPELQQLGYIQDTLEIKSDGKFQRKSDFKSFCGMKAVTPDCVYFWFVFDGNYVVNDKSISFTAVNMQRVLLHEGEKTPKTDLDKMFKPTTTTFTYSLKDNQLTLITNNGKKLPVFKKISK